MKLTYKKNMILKLKKIVLLFFVLGLVFNNKKRQQNEEGKELEVNQTRK